MSTLRSDEAGRRKLTPLARRLKDHPTHLDPPSLAAFMHSFSETDKLDYHGTAADDGSLPALLFSAES